MARGTSFKLDGAVYPTKAAVKKRCQELLNRYGSGETINEFAFLYDLLGYHPNAEQKRGVGIKRFFTMIAAPYLTKCFGLERTDGTKTDFSFGQCTSPSSQFDNLKEAMRNAIRPSIEAFKLKWFIEHQNELLQVQCPDTKRWLLEHEAHVDHVAPTTFKALCQAFLMQKGIVLYQIEVVCKGDNVIAHEIADDNLRREWIAFHDVRCVLEVVSKEANLSIRKIASAAPIVFAALPNSLNGDILTTS